MPRIAPDTFTNYVERSGPLTLRVSSWLGGTRLPLDGRDRIPVVAQSWEISDAADAKTSGEITFEVPNTPAFWPTTDDHPLAANGQRLWAQVGYGSERVSAGWFRILDEPEDNGPTLRVSAKGLSHEIARARFLRPYQSPDGATRLGELRKLVAPIPVVLDAGLSDKALPIYTQDEDRTQAIVDITDTWPARWYIGDDAALHVGPVWDDANPGAPTFTLTGGPGGGSTRTRSTATACRMCPRATSPRSSGRGSSPRGRSGGPNPRGCRGRTARSQGSTRRRSSRPTRLPSSTWRGT